MNYHIDMLPWDIPKKSPHKFDDAGVIMTKIPYTQEYHYHVTAIASQAISNDSKTFTAPIKWLVDNIEKDGSYQHDFVFPFYYGFPKPWIGGLAQGLAISALVQANELETAEKAFLGLSKHCLYKDKHNDVWIEEYPLDEPAFILNGFIYAMFGVYDFYKATEDKKAKKTFDACIKTLVNNIERYDYDIDNWSKYDLFDELPAQPFYHEIHIKQMHVLHNITNNKLFLDKAKKWETGKFSARLKNDCVKHAFMKYGIKGAFARNKERKRWLRGK